MPQPMEFRIRGLGLRGWLMILVGVSVAMAIVVAIAVVAVGVFLFLLPLLAVVATFYYLFGRTKFRGLSPFGNPRVCLIGIDSPHAAHLA